MRIALLCVFLYLPLLCHVVARQERSTRHRSSRFNLLYRIHSRLHGQGKKQITENNRHEPSSVPVEVRHRHLLHSKFKHRKKSLNARGSPKEVIVRVNGQNVYSSKGANSSVNSSVPTPSLPATPPPPPPPPPPQTHNINLHINLTKPASPPAKQSNQPIIVASPPKPQPIVAIVPPMASQPAPVQVQPVVVPPVQPQVQAQVPLTLPTAGTAPPEKKGQSSLSKILLTAALLKSLTGTGSSESTTQGFPSMLQNLLGPNNNPLSSLLPGTSGTAALPSMGHPALAYPQAAIQPVVNPPLGYPQARLPQLGYPALGNLATGAQPLGYPATAGVVGGLNVANPGTMGYPALGTNMGYPAVGNPNMGYPAVGNPNMGYPAVGNPNIRYPAGGNQNMGYPAMGVLPGLNPNMGYPAGGYLPGGVNQNVRYPAGWNPNYRYLDDEKRKNRDPAGGYQNMGFPAGGNQNVGNPSGTTQNMGFPAGGNPNMDAVPTIPNFLSGLSPTPSTRPVEVNNPPLPGPSPGVLPNAAPVGIPGAVPSNTLLPGPSPVGLANAPPVGTPGGVPNLVQGQGQTAILTPGAQPNAVPVGTPGAVTGLGQTQGQGNGTVLPGAVTSTSAGVPGFDPMSSCWCGCEAECPHPCDLCNTGTDNNYNYNYGNQYTTGSVYPTNGRRK